MPDPLESDTHDARLMCRALDLALLGQGAVEPNPMVGCVIEKDGTILAEGYHEQFGHGHAEVNALAKLPSPDMARGATAYVTLEPCCHHGKTPPCSEALIRSGVARVVIAVSDPFPRVRGGGIRQLRAAGIEVTVGVEEARAKELLAPYLKLVHTQQPYVIAKWAMTIDGKIATETGDSQWISSSASRQAVHQLRGRVDAILVGMGTVRADNPTLTARPPGARIAERVVYCRTTVPGLDSNLLQTIDQAPLLIVHSASLDAAVEGLRDAGATLLPCIADTPATMVRQSLTAMGSRGMTNIMLEGGSELLGTFLAEQLVDECQVYVGAKMFGGSRAPGPVGQALVQQVSDASPWRLIATDAFENDVRLTYRRAQKPLADNR